MNTDNLLKRISWNLRFRAVLNATEKTVNRPRTSHKSMHSTERSMKQVYFKTR